jgi:hypothetical protein
VSPANLNLQTVHTDNLCKAYAPFATRFELVPSAIGME